MNQCCQKFIANLKKQKTKKTLKSNVCILIAAYTYTCEDTQSQSETGDKKTVRNKDEQTDKPKTIRNKDRKKTEIQTNSETNRQRDK